MKPITHDTITARLARMARPHTGYCGRCGFPWTLDGKAGPGTVEPHVTDYSAHSGMFPLCEGCWRLLGHPEARAPYYKALIDMWASLGSPVDRDEEQEMIRAVAGGG